MKEVAHSLPNKQKAANMCPYRTCIYTNNYELLYILTKKIFHIKLLSKDYPERRQPDWLLMYANGYLMLEPVNLGLHLSVGCLTLCLPSFFFHILRVELVSQASFFARNECTYSRLFLFSLLSVPSLLHSFISSQCPLL